MKIEVDVRYQDGMFRKSFDIEFPNGQILHVDEASYYAMEAIREGLKSEVKPPSCWPVFAEYNIEGKTAGMDIIAVASNLEQVKDWMPQIVAEDWSEKGKLSLIGYYTCEHNVGVYDQDDYSICRFDLQGNVKEEMCFERTDRDVE